MEVDQSFKITSKKILVVHNRYRYIGGEDIAVEKEIDFLKRFNQVKVLEFENNITNYFSQLISFLTNNNRKSVKLFEKTLNTFEPDIVYIHNLWFKASLGILKKLPYKDTKIILKLHNFRYDCAGSFFAFRHLKGKKICGACGFNKKNNLVFNKYFENSYFKSLLVILFSKKFVSLLEQRNFLILVLTNFHKNFLKLNNYKFKNIDVFPNFIFKDKKINEQNSSLIYAGRISKEKGVAELIDSFLEVSNENDLLKIVGDGPLLKNLKYKYKDNNEIQFFGELPNEQVMKMIKESKAVVTATKLYEGQPTLLCEASASSVPSIFPSYGGINEFFPNNYPYSFNQFDYKNLSEKIKLLLEDDKSHEVGIENFLFIEKKLSSETLKQKFIDIYESVK